MKIIENIYPITKQQIIARYVLLKISRIKGFSTIVRPEDVEMDPEIFFKESIKLIGKVLTVNSNKEGVKITDSYQIFEHIEVHEDDNLVMFETGEGFRDFRFRSITSSLVGENNSINSICWN